ncbi:MAG: sulfatase-like hydrolase/transferase [Planctomycetota bacterium]
MRTRFFHCAAVIVSACFLLVTDLHMAPAEAAEPAAKPNILMIFVDDMGYADPGCYGGKLVPTPNIDRLAAEGVRCTDGYVSAPVCAPSRCGLMTGAYQQRFGMYNNTDRNHYRIPEKQKLMPELLKSAGYATGLIGKWNVPREPQPTFDEAFSVMDWEGDYFPGPDGKYVGVGEGHASAKVQGVWGPEREGDEYLTDRLGRQAVDFIDRHSHQPFFLYLAFNAVHSPWHAKKSDEPRFSHIEEEPLRFYAAMIASLDENIGRVLDKLKQAGIDKSTLVAFVSDNGPAMGSAQIVGWPERWPKKILVGSAAPLSGYKGQFAEGGIRVPFIVRWTARLPQGETYARPVISLDLLPTFCAAAGIEIPPGMVVDGVNLLPYFESKRAGDPHNTLYWTSGQWGAMRQGDWKLIPGANLGGSKLYHLGNDIAEQNDLAKENRELVSQLFADWQQWKSALPPPASEQAKKAKKKQ